MTTQANPSANHLRAAAVGHIDRADSTQESVALSVIIPARNCAGFSRQCLESLKASTFQDFETIVVDDASTDDTASTARQLGAGVISLSRQSGPSEARNCGAEVARADLLLFLDADCCVRPETLQRVFDTFLGDPQLAAMFGSYDAHPRAGNMISQYKNLLHHFVHQQARHDASTFWAGCGAVNRAVFLQVGGFDTRYKRPCIEDIELGVRLRRADHRIRLNKTVQVTHLKKWTFWGMLKSDIADRGVPWTELLLREKSIPNDLNLTTSQRACGVLSLALLTVAAALSTPSLLLMLVLSVALLMVLDVLSATRRIPTVVGILILLIAFAGCAFVGMQVRWWSLVPLTLALAIGQINVKLFAFFARERDPVFAAIVFPLHLFYYMYSSLAFAIGVLSYHWRAMWHRQS